jgi:hypothetical protein
MFIYLHNHEVCIMGNKCVCNETAKSIMPEGGLPENPAIIVYSGGSLHKIPSMKETEASQIQFSKKAISVNNREDARSQDLKFFSEVNLLPETPAKIDPLVPLPSFATIDLAVKSATTSPSGKDSYIVTFADGTIYEGKFANNQMEVYGTLKFINGDKFTGSFEENKINGDGVFMFRDGTLYSGTFFANMPDGKGTVNFSNGDCYEGGFKAGKRSGKGKYVWSNGNSFYGDFANDRFNGKGDHSTVSKSYFKGEFKNGMRSGKGWMTYSNGDVYRGDFKNNLREGWGELRLMAKGVWIRGNFLKDHPDGVCEIAFDDGRVLDVEFQNGLVTDNVVFK